MKRTFIICLILSIITACGGKKSLTYTTEVIDGVTHINNLEPVLSSDDSGIRLEFVQQYGALESDNPDLLMDLPADVAVDSKGDVFIADSRNHQVKKFAGDGSLLLNFGRRGQGPEEFQYPRAVYITSTDELLVTDYVKTSYYTTDGEFTKTLEVKQGSRLTPFTDDLMIESGPVMFSSMQEYKSMIESSKKHPLQQIFNYQGEPVVQFGTLRMYEDFNEMMYLNATSLAVERNGNYWLAFNARNLIEQYSPEGTLLVSSARVLPYEESAEMRKVNGVNRRGDAAIYTIYNRFSRAIKIDGNGRLWIPTYKRQYTENERINDYNTLEDPEIVMLEVYNQDGVLFQRIPWEYGTSRQLVHIHEDRMFFTSWADMCVYEYRIIEEK